MCFVGNEDTEFVAELADHGHDPPRDADITSTAIKKQVNLAFWGCPLF